MTTPPPEDRAAALAEDLQRGGEQAMTAGEKAGELASLPRSVVAPREGDASVIRPTTAQFLIFAMVQAEGITQWGLAPKKRDKELREFWPTEHFLASALGIISARNAAMSWKITGDEKTAVAAQELLNNANFGGGWEEFSAQTTLDLLTQDSGAFVELVRAGDTPESPVIGINHLDAARCFPTGIPETPVIYEDIKGVLHVLKWFEVIQLLEVPAPITPGHAGFFWKLQYSALTRLLRAAQILKSVAIYKDEKISGRYHRGIHLLRGVTASEVQDAIARSEVAADASGLQRYIQPVMVGSVDVNAEIGHEVIELATLPDNFDEEKTIKNYITALAMALLTDYQEFAPLPGGNLGTSAQSEVLHMKSRGKGSALWRQLITRLINMNGVIPSTVTFEFDELDPDADEQAAETSKTRAETREIQVRSGELTSEGARQQALDAGDISQELFDAGGGEDVTTDATVEGEEQTEESGLRTVTPERPVPPGPWALKSNGVPWDGPVHRMSDGSFETGGLSSGFDVRVVPDEPVRALAGRLLRGTKDEDSTTLRDMLISRIHRAFTTLSDDARGLGLMDTTERIQISGIIGQVLKGAEDIFDEEAREVMSRNVEAEDRRVLIAAAKAATDSKPQRRAGPDEERLEFEEEVESAVESGLGAARLLVNRQLRDLAEAESPNGASQTT